jgi:hypothetical protein
MNITDDAWLDEKATANGLTGEGYRTSPATLATKRSRGGGPQFRYFGRRVLYRWGDALAWARSRLSEPVTNTSEATAVRAMRAPEVARAADLHPRIERLSEPVTSTSEATAA